VSQIRRKYVPPSLWALPTRERTRTESVMLWLAVALAFAALGECILTPAVRHLTAQDGWWLNILPAAWFLQTCLRGYRGQPFDRTAVTVGLFCLLPYLFSRARKDHGLPDYLWVSLVLFCGAFALGIWLELRREKTQA
jgi:hypothetical protein